MFLYFYPARRAGVAKVPQNQVRPKIDSNKIFLNASIDKTSFTKHLSYFSSNEQQQLNSILNLIVHYLPYLNISKSVLVLPAGFLSFILYFSSHHLS